MSCEQKGTPRTIAAYIALGSNLQSPTAQIDRATTAIAQISAIDILAMSPYYRSKPLGPQNQSDFINAVIKVATTLPAQALLKSLQDIETRQGRTRDIHWGPRTIDLDIILYGDTIIDEAALCIPHPRAHQRLFVLKPLLDCSMPDKNISIPGKGSVAGLIATLNDQSPLTVIQHEPTHHH